MLITRPVWVLPNNSLATYPFDINHPTNAKGILYEARATFETIGQSYAGSRGGGIATGLARKVNILRADLGIKPASVVTTQKTTGTISSAGTVSTNTVSERVVTANSYLFIKKPTLVTIPEGGGSTETRAITNPSITVNITNPVSGEGSSNEDMSFGFFYTDDPSNFYELKGWGYLPPSNLPLTTTWSTHGWTTPVAQGKKIKFAYYDRDSESLYGGPFFTYGEEHYVCASMEVSLACGSSWNPNTYTVSYEGADTLTPTGFTTVDVPSWIFAPDVMKTRRGAQGYIEYSETLALLGSGYNDYTPWENF